MAGLTPTRGLSTGEIKDVALTRGLSREQVRKRFIRYKDIQEGFYFGPIDTAVVVAAEFDTPMLIGLQAVNRTSVI
jgi:hypothetical protein